MPRTSGGERVTTTTLDQARLDGIAAVTAKTPADWANAFDQEVLNTPIGAQLTVYDVTDVIGKPEGVHPSAIGARMRAASRKGLVVKVGHARRVKHGDDVTLWERVA
jgi:hypothetical protein